MKIDRSHSFTKDDALARVRALTEYWTEKYGVDIRWSGDRASFQGKIKGVKFEGTLSVSERALSADVQAGFLAEKLGARQYVEKKLGDCMDPALSVEQIRAGGARS